MGTKEDFRANIVVAGGGAAGLAAAVAAAEMGAKDVVVLEARKMTGGNGAMILGCMGIESRIQKYLGIRCSRDDVFKGLMTYSKWKGDAILVRALVDKTASIIDWLEEKGVEWGGVLSHYPGQHPRAHHHTKGPGSTGSNIMKALYKSCEALGVRVLTQTRAKRLLTDGKGNVAGIMAETKDGELTIEAKSIILATGGMQGNSELISKLFPAYKVEEILHWGLPHMGDGLQMATEIGAAREGYIVLDGMHGPIYTGGRHLNLTCVAYDPAAIWVNKMGRRFVDEKVVWWFSEASNALFRQPGKICYSLFDEKYRQRVLKEGFTQFYETAATMMAGSKVNVREDWENTADKHFQDEAEKGNLKIADSFDEIARFIGAPAEQLTATINQYNSFCDKGHDDLFAKEAEFLRPLRTPPYYAMPCRVCLLGVSTDIKIDEHMRVLNQEDVPIGGLYAAGNDTTHTDGDTYNVYLTGHAFGFSVSGGRIAGEDAAKYVSGK